MKKVLRNFLVVGVLLFGLTLFGQDNDFFFGKLIDANTGEPVVFATIRLKDKALGVISNNDGGFKIPLDFQFKADSLLISSMGYETKQLDFGVLRKSAINKIFMKPSVFELTETVVTAKKRRTLGGVKGSLTAEQIIKYAIERIPDNYDNDPFELVGYYRDYQLKDKEYTNLNEGLIKVVDKGFNVKDHTSLQFGLYGYEANLDFEVDSFAAKPYDYQSNDKYIPDAVFRQRKIPNELTLLFNHDAIRNNNERTYSYINTFVKDFINEHDFVTYFLTNYGDQKVYKIKFKKNHTPFQVRGDIYIDTDTYAIRKLEYAVYRQVLEEASSTNYSESDMDLLYEILVEYQDYEDHMYLNYISFHNQFKLVRPPKFFIEDVIIDKDSRNMILTLNRPSVNWLKLKTRDFRVYYQGSRLKVKKVVRVGDLGDTYEISFLKKSKPQRKRLRLLISEEKDRQKATLAIAVKKMMDADGNLLAERKSDLLDQFREFFTQKIISGRNKEVANTSYVDKTVSLGQQEQSNIKVEMDEGFWMNTPLKDMTKENQ